MNALRVIALFLILTAAATLYAQAPVIATESRVKGFTYEPTEAYYKQVASFTFNAVIPEGSPPIYDHT